MKIELNFNPTNRNGEPHAIDYSCAQFLQEQLDKRINKERPALEARVANELAESGSCTLDEDSNIENNLTSELEYIRSIVEQLDIDNLLKGQILEKFI